MTTKKRFEVLTKPEMIEELPDGRQRLKDEYLPKEKTSLYNPDIAPLPFAVRSWSLYTIFWVYVGLILCIPSWMAPSGGLGLLSFWQVVLLITIGGLIQTFFSLITAIPGTIYGTPIAVLIRAPFGVHGARLAALWRALVACGWAGVEWWIMSTSLDGIIRILYPPWATWQPLGIIICAIIVEALNIIFTFSSPPLKALIGYKWLNIIGQPIMLAIIASVCAWLVLNAGWENILAAGGGAGLGGWELLRISAVVLLLPSLIWADMAYGAADLTRHSKNRKATVRGLLVALPLLWFITAIVGVITSGGSAVLFGGSPVDWWNPVGTMVAIGARARVWVVIALIAIILLTIDTNVGINLVPGGLNFSNLFPQWIDWKKGVIITIVISILWQPWVLLSTFGAYVDLWLMSAATLMAPIIGIFSCDYYVIHKRKVYLYDLYREDGIYKYWRGWNPCAIISLVLSTVIGISILVIGRLFEVTYLAFLWPIMILIGFVLYYVLMKCWGLKKYQPVEPWCTR
jgi:NCS1 family nucleobase:cation symporter-1